VPPLRERRADIAALLTHFVAQLSAYHGTTPPRFSRAARAAILSYPWPGKHPMSDAVRLAWDAMPDPRFLVAFGACTISGGLYAESTSTERGFLAEVGPALYVPGCPPHPLTFVRAILDLLGVR